MTENPTSVHSQETTDQLSIPRSFREFSLRDHRPEFDSTELAYRKLDDLEGQNRTDRLLDCRRRAWFSVNKETRHVRIATNNCRLRWCPLCSRSLSKFREGALADWLAHVRGSRFLTLTLKHSESPLDHQIEWLYYYFRQLRKTGFFRSLVTGGIWFFQVKRSHKTGDWHPHLHCLLSGKYIPHDRLSELWSKITHGSYIVDIRTIRDQNEISKYVARYSSRPARLIEYSVPDRLEIMTALHGRRLCGKWGTASKVRLSNKFKGDLGEWRNVGSWSEVVKDRKHNKLSAVLFQCWSSNDPLPEYVDCSILSRTGYGFLAGDLPDLINHMMSTGVP